MTEQQALLTAIRDSPNDETPCLVYADWLDENGTTKAARARAEFIRLHCELTRLNGEFNAPECNAHWSRLVARLQKLIQQNYRKWFAAFPVNDELRLNDFWCGFLKGIQLTAAQCLTTPRPPWEMEADLNVILTGTTDEFQKLFASNWLDGAAGLHLLRDENANGDRIAEALAASSSVSGLRCLRFWNDTLTEVGLCAIGGSNRFQHLTQLYLGGDFTSEGWASVVNGPLADRLTHLNFFYMGRILERQPAPDAAVLLAATSRLTRLEELGVTRNRLGAEGLRTLVTAPHLRQLRSLNFGFDPLNEIAGEALAVLSLPKLEKLEITSCLLPDGAMSGFAKNVSFRQLTQLVLPNNAITPVGIRSLVAAGPFPHLESLCLKETQLGDDGVRFLADSQLFPNLVNLDVSGCGIGPKGVKALAEAPWAGQLHRLSLNGNSIKKAGVEALTAPSRFAELRRLDVENAVRSADLKDKLTERFGEGVEF